MVVKMRERKRMYRYPISGILTLLVIVTMAVTAYSGQFEDAVAAYNQKDYWNKVKSGKKTRIENRQRAEQLSK